MQGRFLSVLALLKCAATYSVIDPSNHKTVSVPIGNGMNVDINVTVDVNTGGNEQCKAKGEHCSPRSYECCKGLFCGMTSDFQWLCYQKPRHECKSNEGEACASDDECCEEDNICAGYWTNHREELRQKCQLKPEQCSANKGEECLSDHDCCEKDHVCIVIMKEKRSYCGLKDDYPKPNDCIAEGDHCTKDEDCCEKDYVCKQPDPYMTFMKPICTYKPNDCIADGEPCHGTDDWVHECCSKSCCEGKCGTCGYTPWYKRF